MGGPPSESKNELDQTLSTTAYRQTTPSLSGLRSRGEHTIVFGERADANIWRHLEHMWSHGRNWEWARDHCSCFSLDLVVLSLHGTLYFPVVICRVRRTLRRLARKGSHTDGLRSKLLEALDMRVLHLRLRLSTRLGLLILPCKHNDLHDLSHPDPTQPQQGSHSGCHDANRDLSCLLSRRCWGSTM